MFINPRLNKEKLDYYKRYILLWINIYVFIYKKYKLLTLKLLHKLLNNVLNGSEVIGCLNFRISLHNARNKSLFYYYFLIFQKI